MATSKRTTDKPQFYNLTYSWLAFSGCCGIITPNMFTETGYEYVPDPASFYGSRKAVAKKPQFATREEQAAACIAEIETRARQENYFCIQIALVAEYRSTDPPQYPELQAALVEQGYKVVHEWIAPRHGNKLRLFSKVLDNKENEEVEPLEEEEEENW